MTLVTEVVRFEYNGYSCDIVERPDLLYCKRVHGFNGDVHWFPHVLFDKDLTFEQVQKAAISMLDNNFHGKVEEHCGYLICMEI